MPGKPDTFKSPQTMLVPGTNPKISAGSVPEDIWAGGGLIHFADTPGQVSVVSTSGNDTAAGTGARTLRLTGITDQFEEFTEDLVMNGLTPVLTARTDYLHVQVAEVIAAGSGQRNAGDISFTLDGGVNNYMTAGKSATQSSARIIPAPLQVGTVAYAVNFFAMIGKVGAGGSRAYATLAIPAQFANGIFTETIEIGFSADGAPLNFEFVTPFIVETGSAVVARCETAIGTDIIVATALELAWFS